MDHRDTRQDDGLGTSLAPVTSIGLYSRSHQARRRSQLRSAARDAASWLIAGANGEIPIDVAITEAGFALRPAQRELLKASVW